MKKVILYTLGALAFATVLQSCNKLKDAIPGQDVDFTAATDIVISPANDTTQQIALGQASITYNIDSMIKAQTDNKLGFGDIKSVKIKTLNLHLTDASATNNFANFISATATFSSSANTSPYTLANVQNNPDSYNDVLSPAVVSTSDDVKGYFNSQMTLNYTLAGKLRRPTTETLHCHAEVTYTISVKP